MNGNDWFSERKRPKSVTIAGQFRLTALGCIIIDPIEAEPVAMFEAIEHYDWANTALGNRSNWPASLVTLVDLMLRAGRVY